MVICTAAPRRTVEVAFRVTDDANGTSSVTPTGKLVEECRCPIAIGWRELEDRTALVIATLRICAVEIPRRVQEQGASGSGKVVKHGKRPATAGRRQFVDGGGTRAIKIACR